MTDQEKLNKAICESLDREAEFWKHNERDIAKPSFDDCHDMEKVNVLQVEYDLSDYPDFCDAYIVRAEYEGNELEENELEELNEMKEFVRNAIMNWIF